MDQRELLSLICETNFSYTGLGNDRFEAHGASFIVNPRAPGRHAANCIGLIRTESSTEMERLLERAEGEIEDLHSSGPAPARGIEIREVLSEDDWQVYRELDAMWWKESSSTDLGPYDPALRNEFTISRRLKAPQARALFACVDGVPRAFFSS